MLIRMTLALASGTVNGCGSPAQQPVAETLVVAGEPAATPEPQDRPRLIVDEPNPTHELLDRLEKSGADLRDFQAGIIYTKWDAVLNRREIRTGEVLYQVKPDGSKRFAILLEHLFVGRRKREHRKHYVFDGSWLVEIDHEAKIFIKRQIVAPGKQFDPLKLGEGPFPLPLGQPKAEVLARFKVRRLLRPQDETLAKRLGDRPVDGLLLVPRPQTPEADEIDHVEVFYDRETLLPVGILLVEVEGDRKMVILQDPRANEGVDEQKLSIEDPDPRDGWNIDIRPWKTR